MREVKKTAVFQEFKVIKCLGPKRVKAKKYGVDGKFLGSIFLNLNIYIVLDGNSEYVLPLVTNDLRQGDYIKVFYLNGMYKVRRLKL